MTFRHRVAVILAVLAVAPPACADDPPPPAAAGPLIVIDNAGKEHKVKAWKFVVGTRTLAWQPAKVKDGEEKPKPAGVEVLEFRELNSTTFKDGILTFIPVSTIRSIEFDNDNAKQTMTVKVVVSDNPNADLVLTGSTRYVGINKLTLEASVDMGDKGVADVKFLGGVPKGIQAVRFPAPKAATPVEMGRPALVTGTDKDKSVHAVRDLQPLYRQADGSTALEPLLMFKKTLKVEVAKVRKLHLTGTATNEGTECTVTIGDNEEQTLTLLKTAPFDEKKPATLLGFAARVPAGYKLFPPHTFTDIVFDETKGEPKPALNKWVIP